MKNLDKAIKNMLRREKSKAFAASKIYEHYFKNSDWTVDDVLEAIDRPEDTHFEEIHQVIVKEYV